MAVGDKLELSNRAVNQFYGQIDDLRFYEGLLTPAEIAKVYAGAIDSVTTVSAAAAVVPTLAPPPPSPPPAGCRFRSYIESTDTCRYGVHVSQLTAENYGSKMFFYKDSSGNKMMPYEEGRTPRQQTISYSASVTQIESTCERTDGCQAVAIDSDSRNTRWMKTTVCTSPCFKTARTQHGWFFAFMKTAPSPFSGGGGGGGAHLERHLLHEE